MIEALQTPPTSDRFGHVRLALAVAFFGAVISGAAAQGQNAVILGSVVDAEHNIGLPYAIVSITSLGREQFTNDRGRFVLSDIPAGVVAVRVRHIGFSAADTTVMMRPGDTLHLEVRLVKLVIRLDPMRVVSSKRLHLNAGCPDTARAGENAALVDLMEQMVQNAEQYRLLVRSNPFSLRFADSTVVRTLSGTVTVAPAVLPGVGATDHFVIAASAKPVYRGGNVFRTVRGVDEVFVPEMQDLADREFLANHCFAYGGDTTVDSVRFTRVAFWPVRTLADADIAGTVTLRADGYTLAALDMHTTGVPGRFAKRFASVQVVAEFRELLPGIAVLSHLESFQVPGPELLKSEPSVATRGEIQRLLGVLWANGPP